MIPALTRQSWAAAALLALAIAAHGQARRAAPVLKVEGAAPRAVVSVDGIRHGRVDATGSKTIERLKPGRHTVVVRQVGFADFEQAVTLAPGPPATVRPRKVKLADEAELERQRAEDLALDGKHAQAVSEFRAAIADRETPFPAAQIGLTRSLYALKRLDEALSTIVGVVNANEKDAEARTVYANVLRERGLYEDAAAEYVKAIALAGGRSPEGHVGLGMALNEMGKTDEAIDAIKTGIAENDDAEPVLYQLLGSALEHAGRREEAVAAYERFLELAPNHMLAPAVASVLERLREQGEDGPEEGDGNPFARPHAADYRAPAAPRKPR